MSDSTAARGPIDELVKRYVEPFERGFESVCRERPAGVPARLFEAMVWSLSAGGKRLRPALCLAAAERCGASFDEAFPMACALELTHTASLIHDDLPCIDDDELRRGRPTSHVVFGEALALLAGDAMMTWAFSLALRGLADAGVDPSRANACVLELAHAGGPGGLLGGQVLDTDPASRVGGSDLVYEIARLKTAALLRASCVCGALIGGASGAALDAWSEYGLHVGIAFQIADDVLDVTATREQLGKTPHKDEEQDKITFVSTFGLEGAMRRAVEESEAAADALRSLFPDGDLLIDAALSLAERKS